MFAKSLGLFILASQAVVLAAPSARSAQEDILARSGIEDIQWEVRAFVDGPSMNMTGTVEHVHAALVKMNPNYDDDFAEILAEARSLHEEKTSLEKRFGPQCGARGQPWDYANTEDINDGIGYLRGVAGQPTNGPGPGNCGRVSCSYDSAIWWCNDNDYTFSLPSYNTIADCAQVLVNDCSYVGAGEVVYTLGQNFNGYTIGTVL